VDFKNLDKYRTGGTGNRMQLSIPVPRTASGRVYRFSPNEEAYPRHFLLGNAERPAVVSDEMKARMKQEPGQPRTVCPYSGLIADDDQFVHPDDRAAAIETVRHAALADVQAQFSKMLEGLGSSSGGMIKITTSSSPPPPKPRFYREDLLRELACDTCGRDYGVFAIALFCPDCGAPNIRLHFLREVSLVDAQVELADGLDPNMRELAYRLLGNAHEDVLTGLEATLKTVYLFGKRQAAPTEPPPKVGNDFQNVERGQRRFAELGIDPYGGLTDDELAVLEVNIQKRHVIGHNLGIVDARFAERASDARLGETVHLVAEDIRDFATLALTVVSALDGWLAGQALPIREREKPEIEEDDPTLTEVERRARELGISPLSYRLGAWLSESSADGLEHPSQSEEMSAAFAEIPDPDLREAIGELEADGYIKTWRSISREGVPPVIRRQQLFLTFDPLVGEFDPTLDAVELAEVAREEEKGISAEELHAKTGWSLRRFNPALSRMLREIEDRHVSKTGDATYPTRHFFIDAGDRVSLKRFVERHRTRRS
jgi:hypothetical protein